MKIEPVDPKMVRTDNKRRRAFHEDKIPGLMESMEELGLINPIAVYRPEGGGFVALIAGLHRLEAARRLKWESIIAHVYEGTEAEEQELIEIDENLRRADLTPLERDEHLARRQEIWEGRRNKTAEKSGKSFSTLTGRGNTAFASETAALTGESKQGINARIARAKKIAPDVRDAIRGTDLDKGVVLDKLKKLEPEEQREAVKRAQAGEKIPTKPVDRTGAAASLLGRVPTLDGMPDEQLATLYMGHLEHERMVLEGGYKDDWLIDNGKVYCATLDHKGAPRLDVYELAEAAALCREAWEDEHAET